MKQKSVSGFTLVEMMIAIVIVGVLLAIGVPQFSDLIKNNRMLSLVYELRAVLNNARSEALAERTNVTFCSSNNGTSCSGGWKDGYIAFRDTNGDGKVDNPNTAAGDEIFIAKILDVDTAKFTYSSLPDHLVKFDARGYATGFSGTFTICDDRGATEARGLILTAGGMVRAAENPSDSDVMLDDKGNKLDCT